MEHAPYACGYADGRGGMLAAVAQRVGIDLAAFRVQIEAEEAVLREIATLRAQLDEARGESDNRQRLIEAIMVKLDAIDDGVRLLTAERDEARGYARVLINASLESNCPDWDIIKAVKKWEGK